MALTQKTVVNVMFILYFIFLYIIFLKEKSLSLYCQHIPVFMCNMMQQEHCLQHMPIREILCTVFYCSEHTVYVKHR